MFYLMDLERSIGTGVVHYWNQNKHGYTRDPKEAGVFSEDTAKNAVDSDFDKKTVMIPEEVMKNILK